MSKKIVFGLLIFTVVLMVPIIIVSLSNDEYTIKTEYGDRFIARYDSFEGESTVTYPDSSFYLYLNFRVSDDDFEGVKNTPELRVYRVKSDVVFNCGKGFERLSGDKIDNNAKVVETIKPVLFSSQAFFRQNIRYLLNSKSYCEEAKRIIKLVEDWDCSELSKYGLDSSKNNDKEYIEKYKQDAINALNDYEKQNNSHT